MNFKNKLDRTKISTIKEIKGTEFEKSFGDDIEHLPNNLVIYLSDNIFDFFSSSHGIEIMKETDKIDLSNVFTNKFIYRLSGTFKLMDGEKYIKDCTKHGASDMGFLHAMIENNKEEVAVCRGELYELVRHNIHSIETVEIYAEFVDGLLSEQYFGPPRKEVSISVEQILTSELLDTKDRIKVEIHCSR